MSKKKYGHKLWRGGQKIEIEKEREVVTVLTHNTRELQHIRAMSGVRKVLPVSKGVYKLRVESQSRDQVMDRIRTDNRNVICHHAYRPKGTDNTRYYLTQEIIVKFQADLMPCEVERKLAEKNLKFLKKYRGPENTYLVKVTSETGQNPIKVAEHLVDEGGVVYAEPNLVNRFVGFYEPQDPLFQHQWHLKSSDGDEVIEGAGVSATHAWETTTGERKIVLGIIDDGFDLRHPDFLGSKIVHPKDYVDGDTHPFPGNQNYHGTPCAGVAIAEENGYGVVGVAPGCSFMPVRIPMSALDDALLLDIFEYAGQRADVISCSWGPPPVNAPLPQNLHDMFHHITDRGGAKGKGCLIIFAAGNYNVPLKVSGRSFRWLHYRKGVITTSGPILNGYASHPDVMAVAASTSLKRKARYSNWGKEISVCAPSDNFDPLTNKILEGKGIWTTDNERYGHDFTPRSQFTSAFGGTSSAAPLVAGIAALVLSANPGLRASEVKEIIEMTADEINDPTVRENWCGKGKVNAFKAVAEAKRRHRPTFNE